MSGDLARDVAAAAGLPDDLADRLVGETREDLERDAGELRRFLDSRQTAPARMDDLIRQQAGAGAPPVAADEAPAVSFDGGARGGSVYEPPSMDSEIRAERAMRSIERAALATTYDRAVRPP